MFSFVAFANSSFISTGFPSTYLTKSSRCNSSRTYIHQIVCAKKSSNKKRSKKNVSNKPTRLNKEETTQNDIPITAEIDIDSLDSEIENDISNPIPLELQAEFEEDQKEELPITNESTLRLPDIKTNSVRQNRRDRLKRKAEKRKENETDSPLVSKKTMPTKEIQKLARGYRRGGEEAEELITEIEKNPDFMFQTGNATNEYDFTSALIGSGAPNKQGFYVLPYLQSGHLLLLGIISLAAFIYYPGFPLTEASDTVRENLRRGLILVSLFNSALAVVSFKTAQERKQPATFWAVKTLFLGNLALNELRKNVPTVQAEGIKSSRKKSRK